MNDRLTPELVLSAYCQGCFPMADPETGEISFYEPDPRALIPLDDRFHIPHGLKRALNKKPFELRMDTAFPEVVHACARTDQPEEQWIDDRLKKHTASFTRWASPTVWNAGTRKGCREACTE